MNTKFLEKFEQSLKKYRLENHYTQEFLAEKVGVHATYIGKLERGKNNPSILLLYKISKALKIDLSELFNFEE